MQLQGLQETERFIDLEDIDPLRHLADRGLQRRRLCVGLDRGLLLDHQRQRSGELAAALLGACAGSPVEAAGGDSSGGDGTGSSGAVATTSTVCSSQFMAAKVRALGLEDWVEIRLQDYREIPDGPFDAVASIEMARPWITLVPWPVSEAFAIERTGRYLVPV